LTADEWFQGKDANPKTVDLEAGFTIKEKKAFNPTAQAEETKETKITDAINDKDVSECWDSKMKRRITDAWGLSSSINRPITNCARKTKI
jgi:coronin-1B/1C/6